MCVDMYVSATSIEHACRKMEYIWDTEKIYKCYLPDNVVQNKEKTFIQFAQR